MRVAMLGWEFPPYVTGGLGVHCYELTKALAKLGVEIDFFMPKTKEKRKKGTVGVARVNSNGMVELTGEEQDNIKIIKVKGVGIAPEISPYSRPRATIIDELKKLPPELEFLTEGEAIGELYGENFIRDVERYNKHCIDAVSKMDKHRNYTLIHAHDWLTVPAGVALKRMLKKPLVFTVHSTEHDRAPVPWDKIYSIELLGLRESNIIITVSNRTKWMLVEKMGADPQKIRVVYNGVDSSKFYRRPNRPRNTVLFLGRLAEQKGPFQFIWTAKRVLEKYQDVRFIIVGKGPLMPLLINETIKLGIQDKVFFTGYVPDKYLKMAYAQSDVYVMPSLSEPFGITGLEAMCSGTPVIVSKTSGVGEATTHTLKVDFWDIDKMADRIISLLKYDALHKTLSENALNEVLKFTWGKCAFRTLNVYREVIGLPPLPFKERKGEN